MVYRLGYGNRAGSTLLGGALTLVLPSDVTFVSATGGGTESGGEVSWTLGSVLAGESGFRGGRG